jgi:hypothetical protein
MWPGRNYSSKATADNQLPRCLPPQEASVDIFDGKRCWKQRNAHVYVW